MGSTSPIGTGRRPGLSTAAVRVVAPPASATVPQAWHSPHRPTHFALVQPHSLQRYARVVAARLGAMQQG